MKAHAELLPTINGEVYDADKNPVDDPTKLKYELFAVDHDLKPGDRAYDLATNSFFTVKGEYLAFGAYKQTGRYRKIHGPISKNAVWVQSHDEIEVREIVAEEYSTGEKTNTGVYQVLNPTCLCYH